MLQNIHIKNLALIDEIEVEFGEKLNILTGETGAGKSIIIGSVNMALGKKANKDVIRTGAEYGFVELVFSVTDEYTKDRLKEKDVFTEDDSIILSRRIMPNRSVCRINGETVTMQQMQEVSSLLIDIHGQNEHQSLIKNSKQLQILDHFAGADIVDDLNKVKAYYKDYTAICKEISENSMDNEQRRRELSLIDYEVNEIENANLIIGEDDELEALYKKMSNSQKIGDSISEAYAYLSDGNNNAADLVSRALRNVENAAKYDEELQGICDSINTVDSLLNDLCRDLSDYLGDMSFDEETFYNTEKRLDLINTLKGKYGRTIEDVLKYCEGRKKELEKLNDYDSYLEGLNIKKSALEEKLIVACDKVTKVRKTYAAKLEKEIVAALKDLNFADCRFKVEFKEEESFTSHGKDHISFMIATNPGESLKEIKDVASGGEVSRIMLAVKYVLAGEDKIGTMIFDEIDTGISGRTAQKVAEKLSGIAKNHQVICITHLPQIAAMADTHFLIEKTADENRAFTEIKALTRDGEINELARMTGGADITEAVICSAREMKELADKAKN